MPCLGPETGGVGGLLREGAGVEKFVPFLESLFSLGFEREAGMSREFCRDVPEPWGLSGVIRANRFARFARIG